MSSKKMVSFGSIDFSKLTTDEDYQREAERLLPEYLNATGKAIAEMAWKPLSIMAKPSEKSKFIRESTREFVNSVKRSPRERREHLSKIVEMLKNQ